MSLKKFSQGILFGSLLGGGLGLLLAPRSGNATRKKLKSDVDDATQTTENLDRSLKNFQASLLNLKETANDVLPKVAQETKETLTAFQFQAQPRIDQIKEQMEKIKADLPQ